MNDFSSMLWIEWRKAVRSRLPLWTAVGSLFMPLGIGFLIWVAKNPVISGQLGLVGAKANLLTYAGIEWPAYLSLTALMIAAGGFFLFVLALSWVFGREFSDSTVKDLLAVPVRRSAIVLAKFAAGALWSGGLALVMCLSSLAVGLLIGLPGGSTAVLLYGGRLLLVTALLTFLCVTPFGFFASAGRGYLLPVGMAVLTLMLTNLVTVAGWGERFPWAVAGFYAQANSILPPASYGIVLLASLAGVLVTYWWWMAADQNR